MGDKEKTLTRNEISYGMNQKKKPKLKINMIKGKLKSSFHYEMDYLFI
jgi:hypothetical protein